MCISVVDKFRFQETAKNLFKNLKLLRDSVMNSVGRTLKTGRARWSVLSPMTFERDPRDDHTANFTLYRYRRQNQNLLVTYVSSHTFRITTHYSSCVFEIRNSPFVIDNPATCHSIITTFAFASTAINPPELQIRA